MIYIFDTTAITDLIREHPQVVERVRMQQSSHVLGLCQPVDYEVMRGLLWKTAEAQQRRYRDQIKSQFAWIGLTDADWRQAAAFWALARNTGQQLSDVDVLVAALAHRLGGIVVSSDGDFDALPVSREDWRNPPA